MNARKILLWGIPILIVGLAIACAVLESTFQETHQVAQKSWTTYTAGNSGLADDEVSVIAFDKEGRAWIGTYGGGVSVFDGETWTTYTYTPGNSGLMYGRVFAIALDERDRAWIGSEASLSIFDGETWTTYTPGNSGLMYGSVYAIALDERDRAWIGSEASLSIFDGETWTTYTPDNSGLAGKYVHAIAFDKEGRAWIGTSSGLSILDGETWTTYTQGNSGLASRYVRDIAFDEEGRAWIGTWSGVSVFDGETWTTYTRYNSGLAGSDIRTIAFDEQGRAWIGTMGSGVSLLAGETGTFYTNENSELVSSNVTDIAFDEQGRAWIGTLGGVSVFSPDEGILIPQPLIELSKYLVYFFRFSPAVFVVLVIIWLIALLARGRPKVVEKQVRADWRLWLWWTLANTAGVTVSYITSFVIISLGITVLEASARDPIPIAIVAGIASGSAGGAVSGVIQWLALRRHTPEAARWVSIGAAGFAVSYAVTVIAVMLLQAGLMEGTEGEGIIERAVCLCLIGGGAGTPIGGVLGAVTGIVGGIVRGNAQRLALPVRRVRSGHWTLASSVELAIALIAAGANVAIFSGIFAGFLSASVAARGFLFTVASGAVGGAIAGGVLAQLLQSRAKTPAPEKNTVSPPQNVDSPTDRAVQPPGEEEVE